MPFGLGVFSCMKITDLKLAAPVQAIPTPSVLLMIAFSFSETHHQILQNYYILKLLKSEPNIFLDLKNSFTELTAVGNLLTISD